MNTEDLHRTIKQLRVNEQWLMAKLDAIHEALCPDQCGTWQQRAEQCVDAARALSRNSSTEPR